MSDNFRIFMGLFLIGVIVLTFFGGNTQFSIVGRPFNPDATISKDGDSYVISVEPLLRPTKSMYGIEHRWYSQVVDGRGQKGENILVLPARTSSEDLTIPTSWIQGDLMMSWDVCSISVPVDVRQIRVQFSEPVYQYEIKTAGFPPISGCVSAFDRNAPAVLDGSIKISAPLPDSFHTQEPMPSIADRIISTILRIIDFIILTISGWFR